MPRLFSFLLLSYGLVLSLTTVPAISGDPLPSGIVVTPSRTKTTTIFYNEHVRLLDKAGTIAEWLAVSEEKVWPLPPSRKNGVAE